MSDHPFESPVTSSTRGDEATRRAAELGLTSLVFLAISPCCGVTPPFAPFIGAMALLQASRAPEPRDEAARLRLRLARVGGWIGVVVGGLWLVFVLAYIGLVLFAVAFDPSILS